MIVGRHLLREELERIWTIDRSEVIDHIYHLVHGALVLKAEHYDVDGWPPGEPESYSPVLIDCFARGGWFHGLFDEALLIGAAVLDSRFIGRNLDQLQLKFLHVSASYRRQGLGQRLFGEAKLEAGARGARGLYISATPSRNTVDFYRRLGCVVTRDVDPELFRLEPLDIHLECGIVGR